MPTFTSTGEVAVKLSNGLEVRVATQEEAKEIESKKEEPLQRQDVLESTSFYGGSVWKSARVLAKFLSAEPARVQGKRICELGCGCGLAGLAAGALGAKEVALTDQTTFMAEYNLGRNFQSHPDLARRFRVLPMNYADPLRIAEAGPPFDLVLGSDLMYAADSFSPLAQTIAKLLGPGSSMLMVTPNWPATSSNTSTNPADAVPEDVQAVRSSYNTTALLFPRFWEDFEEPLRAQGFDIRDLSHQSPVSEIIAEVGSDRGPIRVIEITRPALGAAAAAISRL